MARTEEKDSRNSAGGIGETAEKDNRNSEDGFSGSAAGREGWEKEQREQEKRREQLLYALTDILPDWYRAHRRTLPWRDTGDPYDVWLSEIMLQQTRVEAVKAYFLRFKTALPDIAALSACPDEQLLKLWEGLGYYSRARNLKKCANVLMAEYGGALPKDEKALLKLPGIGSYTAGAIASIAFSLPVPAVDGNVLRVYARIAGDESDIALPKTKKKVEASVSAVLQRAKKADREFSPGVFNQALMELGATVCVPNGPPLCALCPARGICTAGKAGTEAALRLPVKSAKKPRRIEEKTVVILADGARFLIQKRPEKGLLAGLYEFPSLPGFCSEEEVLASSEALGFDPVRIRRLPDAKHIFTHIEWRMRGYLVKLAAESRAKPAAYMEKPEGKARDGKTGWIYPQHLFVTGEEAEAAYALPSAFSAFARALGMKSDGEAENA